MRDLLGKLTALDPEVTESLEVVSYFDALTARGAGLGGLVRAAAALAGTTACAELRGRQVAYAADGTKVVSAGHHARAAERTFRSGAVWIEREGELHASDRMITERLAVAVETLESRRGTTRPAETVVDAGCSHLERTTALAGMGIGPSDRVRVIVGGVGGVGGDCFLTATPHGALPTVIDRGGAEPVVEGPAGLGTWVRADHAPESWEAAIVAYRLATHGGGLDVIDSSELGAMLMLARAYDPDAGHPDVTALAELDELSREVLRALVEHDSIRAAAGALGMHHSTVQARNDSLTATLGYNPRSTTGRVRYIAAEFLRIVGG
jgi:hypothetical protein